jgi:hypothetical protein
VQKNSQRLPKVDVGLAVIKVDRTLAQDLKDVTVGIYLYSAVMF